MGGSGGAGADRDRDLAERPPTETSRVIAALLAVNWKQTIGIVRDPWFSTHIAMHAQGSALCERAWKKQQV